MTPGQYGHTTNHNEIVQLFEVLSVRFDKMLTKSQLVGHGTDWLEQNIKGLSNVIATKTQDNSCNNVQKQTMWAVGGQVSNGSGPRNLGFQLEKEPVKQEHSQIYAPGLTAAPELDSEQRFSG